MTTSPSNSSLFSKLPSSSLSLQPFLSSFFSLIYLPQTPGLSLLYTLSPHPLTAVHVSSPGTQLQLIRAAGACLHQNGVASILVHLCRSRDCCGLFSGVWGSQVQVIRLSCSPWRILGTAATSAPRIASFISPHFLKMLKTVNNYFLHQSSDHVYTRNKDLATVSKLMSNSSWHANNCITCLKLLNNERILFFTYTGLLDLFRFI